MNRKSRRTGGPKPISLRCRARCAGKNRRKDSNLACLCHARRKPSNWLESVSTRERKGRTCSTGSEAAGAELFTGQSTSHSLSLPFSSIPSSSLRSPPPSHSFTRPLSTGPARFPTVHRRRICTYKKRLESAAQALPPSVTFFFCLTNSALHVCACTCFVCRECVCFVRVTFVCDARFKQGQGTSWLFPLVRLLTTMTPPSSMTKPPPPLLLPSLMWYSWRFH